VDFSTIVGIIDELMKGGPKAVIVMLTAVIIGLLFDRRRLIKEKTTAEGKIDKIIDDYYKGNLTLADALNSLKVVLYEIKEHF
jgi:hypothetical protein